MAAQQRRDGVFTIAFEGLMLFHGTSSHKTHAVLVNAPAHTDPHVALPNEKVPLRKGDRVSFNVPEGPARTDAVYKKNVLKLKDYIIKGHIHDDVLDQTIENEGILAFITLPKGDLTTLGRLRTKVELTKKNGSKDVRCFPQFVLLQTTANQNFEMRILRSGTIEPDVFPLSMNTTIVISNGSTHDDATPHFPHYALLLNREGEIGEVRRLDEICDDDSDVTRMDSDVAEVLKRRKIPNGDCGPVDNP